MTLIGYARVSTVGQDLLVQERALAGAGVEDRQLYVEKLSGAKRDRPELEHALRALRPGDVLLATKLDRLARSLKHLLEVIERVESAGASLRILDQAIDTSTATGRLVVHILGAVAEMERELIAERTRAALAARPEGKRGGRPRSLDARGVRRVRALRDDSTPVADIARLLEVSRATVYRALESDPDTAE